MILDQGVWSPPALSVFYVYMRLLEGGTLEEGVERARQMLWPTLLVNWPCWGCVNCVTFTLLPLHFRVAWVSLFHVGWNAWLSGMNEKERQRVNANRDI